MHCYMRCTSRSSLAASSTAQVFRRVTALASRALCYYTMRAQSQQEQPAGPSQGAVALEDLLLWLCSYQDLFTRPCEATGKLLAWDPSTHYPIPPTFRPYM
jgi:mediator of RNA polymerase II transcription subunit 27